MRALYSFVFAGCLALGLAGCGADTSSKSTSSSSTGGSGDDASCCRVCVSGKACGDSCISTTNQCRQPSGCACND
jgi:hypothetical protein